MPPDLSSSICAPLHFQEHKQKESSPERRPSAGPLFSTYFLLCFFLPAPCPVMEPLASSHGLGPSTTDASRCTWSPGRPHCAPRCLSPAHCSLGRAQDTARGQLGGSQEFGRQSRGAYQWALVRLGIPELLSHVFAGNYKSPCRAFCTARGFATLGPLQFCLLCK